MAGKQINIKVTDNSPKVKEAFEDAVKKALEECGINAQGYASGAAPVDTGRLAGSITYNWCGHGGFLHSYVASKTEEAFSQKVGGVSDSDHSVYVGTNVEYAPYVELGARGRTPQHFLKNAIANHADQYKKIIQTELQRA